MILILCILMVAFFILNCSLVEPTDLIYDRVELLNSSYLEGFYNITEYRISKFNHTSHVLNGKFEFFIDIDSDFYIEASINYNRLNNNQYTKTIFHVKKTPLCDYMQKLYGLFSSDLGPENGNFPRREHGEKVCPFPKVFYFARLKAEYIKICMNKWSNHSHLGILLDKKLRI